METARKSFSISLREHERRQVDHHRHAHAGADVCGAGGEVAPLGAEGELEPLGELRVEGVYLVPRLREAKSRAKHLHAEVVLLVDHDGQPLVVAHRDGAAGLAGHVLAGHEVPLDEDVPLDLARGPT